MSAAEVARRFEEEIGDGYRFAIVNFANPDMVGHTGVIPAVDPSAVETVDACLGRVVAAVERARRCLSRHAPTTATPSRCSSRTATSPHTAHTTNPVPLFVTIDGVEARGRRDALRSRADLPRSARNSPKRGNDREGSRY